MKIESLNYNIFSIGMTKFVFDFKYNPEKSIQPSTQRVYKQKLNALARGIVTTDGKQRIKEGKDILDNAEDIVKFVEGMKSRQAKSLMMGAIFYSIGRQDFDKDSRGLPLYKLFQSNYYKGKEPTDAGADEE